MGKEEEKAGLNVVFTHEDDSPKHIVLDYPKYARLSGTPKELHIDTSANLPEYAGNPQPAVQAVQDEPRQVEDSNKAPDSDATEKRIFGLKRRLFFILLAILVVIIIVAAVGGAVGGSRAAKNKQVSDASATAAAISAASASASASAASASSTAAGSTSARATQSSNSATKTTSAATKTATPTLSPDKIWNFTAYSLENYQGSSQNISTTGIYDLPFQIVSYGKNSNRA